MSRPAPSRLRRTSVAAVAALATSLPLVALGTPGEALPAPAAVEKPSKPGKPGKKPKFQHRAKVGAQIVRAIVLDATPGVEGGKTVDLRVGRAASNLNTRKQVPSVSTSKNLGGKGLADNDLSALLTALVAKAGPTPGTEDVPETVMVPIPGAPLLTADVSSGATRATWAGKGRCVPGGQDATTSTASTADLALLPDAAPGFSSLLALPGTAHASQSARYLVEKGRAGLTGTATTNLGDLVLFGGMLAVNVVSDPVMTATATGKPGGARIEYTPAVLSITGPDGAPMALPTDGAPAEIDIPLDPLAHVTIQFPGVIKEKVREDGRLAKAKSVALRVVLSLGGQVVADVAVAPLQTKVKVPRGGISC